MRRAASISERLTGRGLLEPVVEPAQKLAGLGLGLGIADDGQLVAAAQDVHAKGLLDPRQVAVIGAAQVDQQPVVGEFQQGFGRRRGNGGRRG